MPGSAATPERERNDMPAEYPRTEENQPSRHPERARYEREVVHTILDEGLFAHVGFVDDGRPGVLPMLLVREGEAVYLHGSTGSHLARTALRLGSLRVAVEMTLVDELVLARSTTNHSVNYRSVVVHGDAIPVRDERRKAELLAALVEKILPGRSRDARRPTAQELRQTAVLEVELSNVSAKVRTGDPIDEPEDLEAPCWAGVLPVRPVWGEPRAAANLDGAIVPPAYLSSGPRVRPA